MLGGVRGGAPPHRWGVRRWCACLVALAVAPAPAAAERTLTLQQCHLAALDANPTIRAAELEPLLAEADYLAAQGLFDPTVTLNYTVTDRTDPLNQRTILSLQGVVRAIDSTTTVVGGGVGGLIASGAQYSISFSRTRSDSTINAAFGTSGEYEMDLTGSLTQPVLRNFGIAITTTNLRVADLERTAANARLRSTVIDTLFTVERAYWQLVLAQEQARVQQNGLALADALVAETQVRLDVGVVAPLAVVEAETARARRQEGVLLAAQAEGDAQDNLHRLLAPRAAAAFWTDAVTPTDTPGLELVGLDVDRLVRDSLRARPELELLRVALLQARMATAFRKNQRLPEVNLRAEYGWRSIETSPHEAFDDLFSGNRPHWLLGVEVRVPWGNRDARGTYRRARLTERGAEFQRRRTEQVIVQDARTAAREVAARLQQVEATRAAQRLQEQQVAAEEAKLEVGVATPFDVRQKQDDMIDAQGRALEALIGYRTSVANLARARGRYLERIGVGITIGPDRDVASPATMVPGRDADPDVGID